MKVYTHPNMPTVWIVEEKEGVWWIVFAQASGWIVRRPYYGDKSILEPYTLPLLGIGLPAEVQKAFKQEVK